MITKKLWKRMIAMALIIVMAIVMAACGKGKEENSGDSIVPGDETKVEAQDPFGAYAETLQVEIPSLSEEKGRRIFRKYVVSRM